MRQTKFPSTKSISPAWLLVDAREQSLGRLASRVSLLLRGKHKPSWSPHTDVGDHVVVINAADAVVTGNKDADKNYYRHSRYPGGLKTEKLAHLRERKPELIIEHAVRGMLPKNSLGKRMLAKLHVYPGLDHKHAANAPVRFETTAEQA